MSENFTNKFMNKTYKEHRENVLLEREKSLMPETQNFVELEIKIRKLTKDRNATGHKLVRARQDLVRSQGISLTEIMTRYNINNDFEAAEKRVQIQAEYRTKVFALRAIYENIEDGIRFISGYRYGTRGTDRVRRLFVRACPGADCKGFLSTAWKCGICEKTTCEECHEIKNDDHTCDPNSVETAKLLARDSRPCPKCACMIFKIDGCDQMWCTQCHTAFSWRHGSIITSIIHNPHYYDYMRTNGTLPRNPLDRPCGGLPDWGLMYQVGLPHANYRATIHAELVIMPWYTRAEFDPNTNRELRIRYMMNELDGDKFKTLIQRDEKNRQKGVDVHNVLEMFVNVMTDIFQKLIVTKNLVLAMAEIDEIRAYVNVSMSNISKTYSNCRVPKIQDDYSWDM